MQFKVLFCAAGLWTCQAFAADPVDKFMGNWQGSVTTGDQAQAVGAYLIPLGDGHYEARRVADFGKRGPDLFRWRGRVRGDQFAFLDDLPIDPLHVTSITNGGVCFAASLGSGKLAGDTAQGTIAGRQTGRFELKQSPRVSPELGKRPPAGAVVWFNGTTSLDQGQSRSGGPPAPWKRLADGVVEVAGGGDIMTKEKFGDHPLHLEFRLPYMPRCFGQARANSGVYIQGRYELQVLDSYGLEGADNECGGFYQIRRPDVNRCFPPLQWQSYDITFHNAQRGADGKKSANARITVVHNGVVIHDHFELPHCTPGAVNQKEGEPGAVSLQDHGNPVQFRNLWVKRL